MVDASIHHPNVQGLEAELGASGSKRLNDAADVVADEDEAGDLAVRLHGPPQRILGILCATFSVRHAAQCARKAAEELCRVEMGPPRRDQVC